ncbi:MAG: alginate lyase family protein, partial [Acidobacteriota bacterium]
WRTALEPSLRRQARCLAANLEHDVPNNHLIGNYRALAWVGLLFEHWPESEGWRKVGLKGLWWEMDRQILPDGVHDERSLSYHPIVLRDLFETWQLARRRGVDTPSHLSETLGKMLCFLVATRTPNGTWPMVNDSVPTYPEDRAALIDSVTSALEQPSERPNRVDDAGVSAFPEAGYAILRPTPDDYLFFDAGPMGPTQVPGHGHADALSFVLYGNGRPLIVDPGVDTYEAGQRRDELRSIAVHNTVTVDDQEPCTFWGPFRVTDLPGACLIEWSESHLLGQHQGYKRLAHGVTHHRRITWLDDGCWEIHDRFEGVGEHTFAFNLQLAPGAQVDLEGLDAVARWSDGTQLVMRPDVPLAEARTEIVEGWVAPDWNRRVAASRYLLRWNAQVPFELRTRLEVDIV